MKKWVALLFVCIFANSFSQTNISPQFSELKGMEDQLGNTHLFYRIYSSYSNDPFYDISNDIYHFDLTTLLDSLFLEDYSHSDPVMSFFRSVNNYTFWNDDFTKYIFCGSMGSWEPGPYIKRFDSDYIFLNYLCCEVNQIDISSNNDSLIYSGGWLDNGSSLRSIDGGFNWDTFNESLKFISLSPFSNNILFAFDNNDDLVKSSDGGNSFYFVDTIGNYNWDKILYDIDENHIYRTTFKYPSHFLIVSDNQGEPYSWETKYSSDSEFFISIDESISGTIYLSDKRQIYLSDNYGSNFIPILTLESDIVGLYIKPYSKFLFAATQYRIYEMNLWEDSLKIIKSITPVSENYGWFPLNIGNYWVYSVYTSEGGQTIYWGDETRAVVDTQTSNPGSQVFVYQSKYVNGDVDTTYLKLDSLSGKLYASSSVNGDYLLFDDLTAETGDTVCYEFNPAWNCQYVQLERDFTEFGMNTLIKDYYPQAPGWYFGHSLVKGVGLYERYNGDLTTFKSILKGFIIDGIVYGDTTTVGVEDEKAPIATNFKLEQNYPNPFNPVTSIQYEVSSKQFVTLKVYDVLGNEIVTLVNEEKPAGEYEVEFRIHSVEGRNLPSGVYFYQLRIGGPETSSPQGQAEQKNIQTKKMILLK